MRRSSIVLGLMVLVIGVVLGVAGVALTAERHPEIRAAQADLARAKHRLEHAAHDFAGHRVKAIAHIDEAQEELRMALESDRH
jgi:uncharacterized membrane-anchored protein YhcB (DUF1043 family)